MPLNYAVPAEGYVSSYQISATPYVTSSQVALGDVHEIDFGYVARFIIVRNTSPSGSNIAVAFTENGLLPSNSNYFILNGTESFSADMRVDRLFISGSAGTPTYTVIGGLTFIPSRNFVTITGSNGYGGVG